MDTAEPSDGTGVASIDHTGDFWGWRTAKKMAHL
jgi:hypothetical protein